MGKFTNILKVWVTTEAEYITEQVKTYSEILFLKYRQNPTAVFWTMEIQMQRFLNVCFESAKAQLGS